MGQNTHSKGERVKIPLLPNNVAKRSRMTGSQHIQYCVFTNFQKKTYPSAAVGQVNPPKFEKCDDMVNLTYLNDASVFHNLEGRYKAKLIHTCKYIKTTLRCRHDT